MVVPKKVSLGEEQKKSYQLLEHTADNYFVTGKAGTGKSMLLSYFMAHTSKKIIVLAPTGVAAINVGGQTIHSFCSMSPSFQDVLIDSERHHLRESSKKVLRQIDAIVIDEISMVRADVLTMLDAKARFARRKHLPFGGCQIIIFGDPYQLQPIGIDWRDADVYERFHQQYRGTYFFDTTTYDHANFRLIELQKVYRQTNTSDVEILNKIRAGDTSQELLDSINSKCLGRELPQHITLTARNYEADRANLEGLESIYDESRTYYGEFEGEMDAKDCITPARLVLKVGAQVMMTKNDCPEDGQERRWVNGTLATVTYLGEDYIEVDIDGHEYTVEKTTWKKYGFMNVYDEELREMVPKKVIVGSFTQFPVKLAYAVTIHKSQGQTYDAVNIDLGRGAFATGQTYVALSRCRSLDTLSLARPLTASDIMVDPTVIKFMGGHP